MAADALVTICLLAGLLAVIAVVEAAAALAAAEAEGCKVRIF